MLNKELFRYLLFIIHYSLVTMSLQKVIIKVDLSPYFTNKELIQLMLINQTFKNVFFNQLLNRSGITLKKYIQKSKLKHYQKENALIYKENIFTFPSKFLTIWKKMAYEEIKASYGDVFDSIQQSSIFFKSGSYHLIMNRTMVDPSLNFVEQRTDQQEKIKQTLTAISDSNEFQCEFSNMQEILSRQRQILKKVGEESKRFEQEQKKREEADLSSLEASYAIILCHGGYFSLGIYQKNKCVLHKSDHKYVVRGKQGQRQLNKDGNAGSSIKSMGSQIRRDQEKKHQAKIQNIISLCLGELQKAQVIFLQAPGVNLQILMEDENLQQLKDKIRSICVTAKKANHTEVERIQKNISKVYLVEKVEESNDFF